MLAKESSTDATIKSHKVVLVKEHYLFRSCQPLSESHLKVVPIYPTGANLPPIDIFYRIMKFPKFGTIQSKVFDPYSRKIVLRVFQSNDPFSQHQVSNDQICFIVSPANVGHRLQDTVQLVVTTNDTYLHRSSVVILKIFIGLSNVNDFNQHIFFHRLSWPVSENASLQLAAAGFTLRRSVEPFLHNASFQLVRLPLGGYLQVRGRRLGVNSVVRPVELQANLVWYRALPLSSGSPWIDRAELQLLVPDRTSDSDGPPQHITLSFTILPTERYTETATHCAKHASIIIAPGFLGDHTSRPEMCDKLYFTLRTAPTHGHCMLQYPGAQGVVSTERPLSVLCAEIGRHLFLYKNTNADADSDFVRLDLFHVDFPGAPLQQYGIRIALDAYQLDLDMAPIGIRQCRPMVTISGDHMKVAAATSVLDWNITFTISRGPRYGGIFFDLLPVSVFTYRDVLQSRIAYVPSLEMRSRDEFDVTVAVGLARIRVKTVTAVVTVVSAVVVRPAVVVVGAKLIITSQHLDVRPLVQCSNSYVLFTVQNAQLKYGELARESAPGDNSFTSYHIESHRLVYESFSFFQKEIGELIPRQQRPVLVEEIHLSVSTPNASLLVQPSLVTLFIQITTREYRDKLLQSSSRNVSVSQGINASLAEDAAYEYQWVRESFSVATLLLVFLALLLVVVAILVVWYCVKFHSIDRRHMVSHLISAFHTMKLPANGQCVNRSHQSGSIFTNRLFIDNTDNTVLANENIVMNSKDLSQSMSTDMNDGDEPQELAVNRIKYWL